MKGKLLSRFSKESKDVASLESVEESNETPSADDDIKDGNIEEKDVGTPKSIDVLRDRRHALFIMAKHTYVEGREQDLICDIRHDSDERLVLKGVAMRVTKGEFATYPPTREGGFSTWVTALSVLNVGVSDVKVTRLMEA